MTRNFAKRCRFTTSEIGSRASRYEESLARGAFQSGANFRYPLVDTKRRARECPAFFRIPIHVKTFGVSVHRRPTLWFETKHGPPCRNATFRHGTPFQTDQNSLTLWLTTPSRLTGRFAKGVRTGQLSNRVRFVNRRVCFQYGFPAHRTLACGIQHNPFPQLIGLPATGFRSDPSQERVSKTELAERESPQGK